MDDLPFAARCSTCEPAVELAEKLGALASGDLSKCLFTTGGSDAVEVALCLARAATGRFKTLSFWDAFHGGGFGAANVGGEHTFRSGVAGPLLPGAEHVAPFACYRCLMIGVEIVTTAPRGRPATTWPSGPTTAASMRGSVSKSARSAS